MKTWFKQILSLAMALTLLMGCFPLAAFAAEGTTTGKLGDNITWTLSGGHLDITGTGKMYDYGGASEPEYLSNRIDITSVTVSEGITSICDGAFCLCPNLTSVQLPSSLKTIGSAAFSYCSSLRTISVPDSVSVIGGSAFQNCDALSDIKLPRGLEILEFSMFRNCSSLEKLDLPVGLTQVNAWAFTDCTALTKVTVPVSVSFFGSEAFAGCTGLEEVVYAGSEKQWKAVWTTDNEEILKGKVVFAQTDTHTHTPKKYSLKPATLTENGRRLYYKCTICGGLFDDKACTQITGKNSLSICKVGEIRLSSTSYTYDGKTKRPAVGVYDASGSKLLKDHHYTVSYSSGRKAVGEYRVTVKGKGEYSFTKTLTFKINPPKTGISSLTAKTKSFVAKWSKKTSQVAGYQLQYSTAADFSSGVETVTIKDNTATSKTIKGLKAKKTYYVRIRTYKKVDSKNFYSEWSSVKSIKTK